MNLNPNFNVSSYRYKHMQSDLLATNLIEFFGNCSPTKKQIEMMKSIIYNVGILIPVSFDNRLTKREIECLTLAALGYSAKDSASVLNIDKKTVEEHKKNMKKKLGCKRMAQAVVQGIKYGYLKPSIN